MMGEYGALIGTNGFFRTFAVLPTDIMNFLKTSDGQLCAAVFALVFLLIHLRKR
jgi:hypothetical protein